MKLLKLFRKKLKITHNGFTFVELTVVIAITGIITTFLLSMLIATNTHMNNDLISIKSTAELRKAQTFFENWVRYNDKAGVTFTGTDNASDSSYVSNSTDNTKKQYETENGMLKVIGDSNGRNQGDTSELCGYYTQIEVGSGNTSISFDMGWEKTITDQLLNNFMASGNAFDLKNVAQITHIIVKMQNPYANGYGTVYLDNITNSSIVPATTTTTTTTTASTVPKSTFAPVADDAVNIAAASSNSKLTFSTSEKQLSIQGYVIDEWPKDESGNPEISIKFNLITDITVDVSEDGKMVKCICKIDQGGGSREFTFIYARRAG